MGLVVSFSHRKIQQGNIKEFEKLFRKLYADLCHYAFKYLKDMDAAEEIVQDLFYSYWKNRGRIEVKTSLKSYLYQATKNRCLKSIEHNAVKEKYSRELQVENLTETPEASQEIETEELTEIIEKTLDQLPERCREIFVMSRFDGLKYAEIAEKLSVSVKTVEANMGKALKLFRLNLKQYNQIPC
ncbi:MAG: RNA polymerase sigma-70 factor [Tenuifilaceae bacterium]|jgi:RNA polymerase sigma-70 factor (ECF subfamily)|nr:RNA polymerase sigma-70 factor [Tenuifilaceae bacterium]